jgi:hypothetical protein
MLTLQILSMRYRAALTLTGLVAIGCALPRPAASAEAVRFAIAGVGEGNFGSAVFAVKPGTPPDGSRAPCLTLADGSRQNSDALLTWMKSNSAGAALATRPNATVTVLEDQGELEKGVYRLVDITVRSFRLVADRDLSDPRLGGAEINCDAIEVAF